MIIKDTTVAAMSPVDQQSSVKPMTNNNNGMCVVLGKASTGQRFATLFKAENLIM